MIREGDFELMLKGQRLVLLKEKAIWWPENKTLILSDLHLGKAGHFRKHGLPLHNDAHKDDNDRLELLIDTFSIERVLIIGDLFHSEYNNEWELLIKFTGAFPNTTFRLVPGNHDILKPEQYHRAGITLLPDHYHEGPFLFVHDCDIDNDTDSFIICGHLHPGIRLTGRGRQSLALPAFFVDERRLALPAFGVLTGLNILEKFEGENVYLVSPTGVLPMAARA